MNVRFLNDDSIFVGHSVFDYEVINKGYLADYLLGKLDVDLIISKNQVNERQTLLGWLPFIDMIFVYSTEELRLEKNEIAIIFRDGVSEAIVMKVSNELYDIIAKRDWFFIRA